MGALAVQEEGGVKVHNVVRGEGVIRSIAHA